MHVHVQTEFMLFGTSPIIECYFTLLILEYVTQEV